MGKVGLKPNRASASVRQARWRKNTSLRRVELYLSPKAVEWLDDLAREHGASGRAEVVEKLLTGVMLPPLLADVRRELREAYQTLLQAATYGRVWAVDVRNIMGKAMRQLREYGTSPVDRPSSEHR